MIAQNFLVVVVDGLRASALGAYGNTSYPMPALDHFAAGSFLLDWCYAPTADLAGIYAALWHTKYSAGQTEVNASESLPRAFASMGYATTLLTDELQLEKLAAADEFGDCLQLHDATAAASRVHADETADTSLARLFASAGELVASNDSKSPQLVWLHSRGMYGPWDAPLALQESLLDEGDLPPVDQVTPPDVMLTESDDPDTAFRFACAYAAQCMVLDDCWHELMSALDVQGTREQWTVVLLGARGFPMGEHRRMGGIDSRLYAEQLHVPWLFRRSDGLGQLSRSGQLTSHIDLLPTLIDCIGGESSAPRNSEDRDRGFSIVPLVKSARLEWRPALVATSANGARAIRTADWCLRIENAAAAELFVRPDDRWEANDVAKLCSDVVDSLTQQIDLELKSPSGAAP